MLKRLIWFWKTNRLGPDILSSYPLLFFKKSMRWICKKKFASFGEGSDFRPGAYAMNTKSIKLGRNVIIRPGTCLFGSPIIKDSIIIEEDVLIGSGVHFYTFNHIYNDTQIPIKYQGNITKPIRVCTGSWIGANSIILSGVTIGENSVVGAGSVVTKDIPPRTVYAGNPARKIRDIEGS